VNVAALSDHAQALVGQEREVIAERVEELREQSRRLHGVVDQVDAELADAARILRRIDELLGLAPQLSLDALGEIRGRKLQEVAVEILRHEQGIGAEVHYRDWYDLVVRAGARIAGQDPIASFLTQIAKAPGVESVRPRSGIYRLRAA
jgi:hypothetical protein